MENRFRYLIGDSGAGGRSDIAQLKAGALPANSCLPPLEAEQIIISHADGCAKCKGHTK